MTFDEHHVRATILSVQNRLRTKSASLLLSIENRLPRIMTLWFVLAILASTVRILVSPIHGVPDLTTFAPYALLVGAPLASMGLALIWFRRGDELPQPHTRLAIVGRWRNISRDEARRHALYGSSGIMVSLLVGMLLNVPVRSLEYLAAIPAFPAASQPGSRPFMSR